MQVKGMTAFALVVGLVSGYQVGQATPWSAPVAPERVPLDGTVVSDPTGRQRVLLVGDSVLPQTGPALARRLGPGHSVRNVAVNGSGLLTPAFFDWPRRLERVLATAPPDVVVLAFVGNYTGDPDKLWVTAEDRTVVSIESRAFARAWGRQTDAAVAAITATGAEVVLVLPPPMPVPVLQDAADALRAEYLAVAERRPGVRLADGTEALAGPGGSWTSTGRAADGVHLSDHGERLLAAAVAAAVIA